MKTTLDLLSKTKETLDISERALSIKLGHSPTNITTGKQSGSLSPVLAGQLAELIGEPVERWMSIAYLESQPRSRVTDHLRRALTAARNSWLKPLVSALNSRSRRRPLAPHARHA